MTVMACGVSRRGVSVFVPVALRRTTYPATGLVAVSWVPVTCTAGSVAVVSEAVFWAWAPGAARPATMAMAQARAGRAQAARDRVFNIFPCVMTITVTRIRTIIDSEGIIYRSRAGVTPLSVPPARWLRHGSGGQAAGSLGGVLNARRRILPTGVRGRSLQNSTWRGTL